MDQPVTEDELREKVEDGDVRKTETVMEHVCLNVE